MGYFSLKWVLADGCGKRQRADWRNGHNERGESHEAPCLFPTGINNIGDCYIRHAIHSWQESMALCIYNKPRKNNILPIHAFGLL